MLSQNPATTKVTAEFPEALGFLFEPCRYKVAYGGRGGAKSWGFARALLLSGAQRSLRILCARETQKSIADSVHKLLSDQIPALGLKQQYAVEKSRIIGANETEFTFAGLKHNIDNIKSLEAYDIVWVEEAQSVSRTSWNKLIPTIRKEGSEIWVSFNPDLETDDTYQRFVVHPPKNAIVRKINWRDNPWFPAVLKEEMETLRDRDPDGFNHVYEGCCISMLKGAIYANELRQVDADGRIRRVPYDPSRPVDCFWDLGFGDMNCIWFVQSFPFEYRLIDYLEGQQKAIQWYIQQMQSKGYIYGNDWLPWDVGMHAQSMGSGKSIEETLRQAGRKVRILPRLPIKDRLAAARTIFPLCWFDSERCSDGIFALRHYRFGESGTLKDQHGNPLPSNEPLHDWASHASDAFGYFAIGAKQPRVEAPPRPPRPKVPVSVWS